MKQKSVVIIGLGEVGQGLKKVLDGTIYPVDVDKFFPPDAADFVHICFPYGKDFEKEVRRYQKLIRCKNWIIHSTVPIGTSKKLNCHHSPVRGVHPNLDKGIRTFVKYLAPGNKEIVQHFKDSGIVVQQVKHSEDTEALKIWDTTYYGWNIIFEKLVYAWCVAAGRDFNIIYTHANTTYNQGYEKLGRKDVVRPVLRHQGGPIGGHCVLPNLRFLTNGFGKAVANFIQKWTSTMN